MISVNEIEDYLSVKYHTRVELNKDFIDLSGRRKAFIYKSNINKNFFVKFSLGKDSNIKLECEVDALDEINKIKGLRTPDVIGIVEGDNESALILKAEQTKVADNKDWAEFGKMIALMHKQTRNVFGLDKDNYIGDYKQINLINNNWNDFYINNRINPMLDLIKEKNLMNNIEINKLKKVVTKIEEITQGYKPEASLIHGDLWIGNSLFTNNGPMIIDPSIYYGSREMDIAFSNMLPQLKFPSDFYDSYKKHYPFQDGYEQRENLWQIYPLLIHIIQDGRKYVPVLLEKISIY